MTGEPGLEFGDHLGERAPGVVLKMPLRRDDVRHEPFELVPIVDQLGEQMAQIPVEQDAAYIEDHALANHAAPMHAKAPPEASDGVTPKNLGTSKSKRGENTPRRGISPGAP